MCSLLNCDLGFLYRAVRAMGCFFGCFRIKDDRRLVAKSSSPKTREAPIPHNPLSSLFASEEKEDSPCKDKGGQAFESHRPDSIDRELKEEAKFLVACGTLLETPAEIRKTSEQLKGLLPHGGDSEPPKFHSWLPNTSASKLLLDKQIDQPPTPIKTSEEWVKGSDFSENTPSSCISDAQNTRRISTGSMEDSGFESVHDNSNSNVRGRNKSVRFECESGGPLPSSSDSSSLSAFKKFESPGNHSVSKPSPYPTPLKLTDEMQTPGTALPANLATGANVRVRPQFVYPEWKVMKEGEDSNSDTRGSLEIATPNKQESCVTEDVSKVEASLSSWLKPKPSNWDSYSQSLPNGNPYFGRTPGDRPILGTVAAHWNEEEACNHISPKWWDGNGIPNSTNKYKEDQKVSWHATPFEERLEKALSEETIIAQRKDISGTPIVFEENEESDTAVSQLKSLSQPKPVVSF